MAEQQVRVLFVCLGNICRSPTAHGVFEALVKTEGLSHRIEVDSAATSDWHIGKAPDPRSVAMAKERGVDLSAQRARQVSAEDFHRFDYILAMDAQNLRDLQRIQPAGSRAHLSLFLAFDRDGGEQEVPDPYYGGKEGFAKVVDLVERASHALLQHINEWNLKP
ncbi:low molecular weight protein-tyrosine-phosphatase [Pseudomaricurvus sp. HS19]|uniref:low molecular weight protein-tyrosine-phosphatase n=1 Tax=Pseudomaricurvus sp. HS19 TaxID=2692626 RepID=UPI00136BE305|nr:low molecular weight protein-tyrosine-phosphatase [Pseudomaricurvus sp. HS19]MYM62696.1 low molecular weight phosphotyrosine protein phosphatase [Pseudomaricurvus sp. HS19]